MIVSCSNSSCCEEDIGGGVCIRGEFPVLLFVIGIIGIPLPKDAARLDMVCLILCAKGIVCPSSSNWAIGRGGVVMPPDSFITEATCGVDILVCVAIFCRGFVVVLGCEVCTERDGSGYRGRSLFISDKALRDPEADLSSSTA